MDFVVFFLLGVTMASEFYVPKQGNHSKENCDIYSTAKFGGHE